MKKIILYLSFTAISWTVQSENVQTKTPVKETVKVYIDLVNIKNDKVLVTIKPPKITTNEIIFYIPKTVPGTYSTDNYGRYIDDLKAYDKKGNILPVTKKDVNSWCIVNSKKLDKITYLVNDSYDTEKGEGFGSKDIFSPSGSNIDSDKNIMLNTHCFVGYFLNFMAIPYEVTIAHPETLWGATSMTDQNNSSTQDLFISTRYAHLVENPIMYCKPDYTSFKVDDMEILIAVYSPSKKITADDITPAMKTMMTAQKKFLGAVDSTKKYTVLLYLSTMNNDAMGFGALEHPTSTTVVFPEIMSKDELTQQLKDVVSHEFFHILTPLTVHAEEIQNFDYNNPKMSEHLWMYEGVTEYFANLFQISQGLIQEEEFYSRIAQKIQNAKGRNDTMPFTKMSKNVLEEPYKAQYLNVYDKGALIGMCLDIILRENSNGTRGILDLMQKLSKEYGVSKAFNDDVLFSKITELTYPAVGEFLKTYVSGGSPIPYDKYFAKVGVSETTIKSPMNIFLKGQVPYITVNQSSKEISVLPSIELNEFYTTLGLKGGDILLSFNDKKYNLDTIYDMISDSEKWKDNSTITVKINRNGKEQIITGKVKVPFEDATSFQANDITKADLKNSWLKG